MHECVVKNIFHGSPLLTLGLYFFGGGDVSDAEDRGADRNFPNPVQVLGRLGIHVESGSLDRVVAREVRPEGHFRRTIVKRANMEFARQERGCESGGVDKPRGSELFSACGVHGGDPFSGFLRPDDFVPNHGDAAIEHLAQEFLVQAHAVDVERA